MCRPFIAFALLVLFPTAVFAASFAKQSLFLSKSPVIEGETVLIHAVLANDTETQFKGEVRIRSGQELLGSVPLTLGAGEARAVSISWAPKAGLHTIAAELRAQDESLAAKEEATFTVEEKPKPLGARTSTESATVESSAQIQHAIAGVSPQAAQTAKPVLDTLDSWRARGTEFLDAQISNTKERVPGTVLGTNAVKEASSDPAGSAWGVLQTFYLYLLTILRYIMASASLFYPVLAILFLWGLWRLYKRMARR